MRNLEEVLSWVEAAAGSAELLLPAGSTPDEVARQSAIWARIARAAIAAHNQVAGEPLDLTKLHQLPSV